MKGIVVNRSEGAEELRLAEIEPPKPRRGELLVKVSAAAVNRTDIAHRKWAIAYAASPVLGVEIAGTVVEAVEGSSFSVGDRVMGLVNGGGYAEYAVMPADRAMLIPDGLSFAEAAAIPEVFLTAYQTLFWIGRLQERESVLIHAGASGVGTAAIQLAKKLRGAKVIVTAGSRDKLDFCTKLGADTAIHHKEQSFDEEVLKATDGRGVDMILDFIGASYWEKNFNSIASEGRWVLIGNLGGNFVERIDLLQLMSKYVQLTGTLLTPRSDDYKARLTADFVRDVIPLFDKREISPIIDSVYPISEAEEAHQRMISNQNTGTIILEWN